MILCEKSLPMSFQPTRREFLTTTAALTATGLLGRNSVGAVDEPAKPQLKLAVKYGMIGGK
jgi:hypothetical protein